MTCDTDWCAGNLATRSRLPDPTPEKRWRTYDLGGRRPAFRVDETWNGRDTDTIFVGDEAEARAVAAAFVESGHGARVYRATAGATYESRGLTVPTDGWALVEELAQDA